MRLEFTEYADVLASQTPSTPQEALGEYLEEFAPTTEAAEFDEAHDGPAATLYVDEVAGESKAAAVATATEDGWRVRAFAECRSYAEAVEASGE